MNSRLTHLARHLSSPSGVGLRGHYAALTGFHRALAERAFAGCVDGTLRSDEQDLELATFAGGCFWGPQLFFDRITGVVSTSVGYTQGAEPEPTYDMVSAAALLQRGVHLLCLTCHAVAIFRCSIATLTLPRVPPHTRFRFHVVRCKICRGSSGHTEAVAVAFDPAKVAYSELISTFLDFIDPTQVDGQGNDWGSQYRVRRSGLGRLNIMEETAYSCTNRLPVRQPA